MLSEFCMFSYYLGLPGGSDDKEFAYNWEYLDSVPGLGRSLGKEMATHSNILAWEILWTEEHGRLLTGVAKDMTEHFHFPTAYLSCIVSDEMSAMLCYSSLLGNKWSESHSVMSNSLQLYGLNSPWNSPGQNTGVGSHSLLQGIEPKDWTQVSHIIGRFFTVCMRSCFILTAYQSFSLSLDFNILLWCNWM